MEERRLRTLPSFLASGVAWLAYVFLVLPSLIVVPMSFSGAQYLEFPPREWSLR